MREPLSEPRTTSNTGPEQVSEADVEHVAALASLALTPEEVSRLGQDLRGVLGYVAELQELDTTGVLPLLHVSELYPPSAKAGEAALRADEPQASLARELVMRGAPATDGAFFKVPKVIER